MRGATIVLLGVFAFIALAGIARAINAYATGSGGNVASALAGVQSNGNDGCDPH
jgi:hypothetical protein